MKRILYFFEFLQFYIRDIVVSNFRVAYDVLTPQYHMTPGVLAVDVAGLKDHQIVLVANFITMTPGTLALLVSPDRKTLYVHAMYVDDTVESMAEELNTNYGRRVRRVF